MIGFIDSNLFLSELIFKWSMIKFLGVLKRKGFVSVKQSVSLLKGFSGLRFWPMLEFLGDISIFSIEWEQRGSEPHILTYIKHFQ